MVPKPLLTGSIESKVKVATEFYLSDKNISTNIEAKFGSDIYDNVFNLYQEEQFEKNTFLQYLSKLSRDTNCRITTEGRRQGYYLTNTVSVINEEQVEQIRTAATQRESRVEKEKRLYPILVKELITRGYSATDISAKRGLGIWGNPDVAGIKITQLRSTCSTSIEIVTVEVKVNSLSWRMDIFEAVSHRRYANRAYFSFACPDSYYIKLPLSEMRYYAELFKIGILVVLMKDEDFLKLETGKDVTFDEEDKFDVIEINSAPYEYVRPEYQEEFCQAQIIQDTEKLFEWGTKPPKLS